MDINVSDLLNNISSGVIKEQRISRAELSALLWGTINDISTHSLSMWLKSKTNDKFVVVPRSFVLECVKFLEQSYEDYGMENMKCLEAIKMYL